MLSAEYGFVLCLGVNPTLLNGGEFDQLSKGEVDFDQFPLELYPIFMANVKIYDLFRLDEHQPTLNPLGWGSDVIVLPLDNRICIEAQHTLLHDKLLVRICKGVQLCVRLNIRVLRKSRLKFIIDEEQMFLSHLQFGYVRCEFTALSSCDLNIQQSLSERRALAKETHGDCCSIAMGDVGERDKEGEYSVAYTPPLQSAICSEG